MHEAEEYAPTCKRCGAEMRAEEKPEKYDPTQVPD